VFESNAPPASKAWYIKTATTYFWYNGSTSCNGGEREEETEVKARREKSPEETHIRDPKLRELPMSKLKCE